MRISLIPFVAASFVGCAQQNVCDSVARTTAAEGKEYALEVAAQSPFKSVEIAWSEATQLMQSRNRKFIAAQNAYAAATEKNNQVIELTGDVKNAVSGSLRSAIKPSSMIESLRSPATQIPKQLLSLASIKDLPHLIQQTAWEKTVAAIDAELAMRQEQVALHRLLQLGELIGTEIQLLQSAPAPSPDDDPEVIAAMGKWRVALQDVRKTWLAEVRDLFDAEYHDVRFIKDDSGLTNYRDTIQPDLSDWQRWCSLQRSKELVAALSQEHSKQKSAIPGSLLVTNSLNEMIQPESAESQRVRDSSAIRREVRNLIQSWRKLKSAQQQSAKLEAKPDFTSPAAVSARQKYFELRKAEIDHASVIWMLDEHCWPDSPISQKFHR